jgi:hypothetical protein
MPPPAAGAAALRELRRVVASNSSVQPADGLFRASIEPARSCRADPVRQGKRNRSASSDPMSCALGLGDLTPIQAIDHARMAPPCTAPLTRRRERAIDIHWDIAKIGHGESSKNYACEYGATVRSPGTSDRDPVWRIHGVRPGHKEIGVARTAHRAPSARLLDPHCGSADRIPRAARAWRTFDMFRP